MVVVIFSLSLLSRKRDRHDVCVVSSDLVRVVVAVVGLNVVDTHTYFYPACVVFLCIADGTRYTGDCFCAANCWLISTAVCFIFARRRIEILSVSYF